MRKQISFQYQKQPKKNLKTFFALSDVTQAQEDIMESQLSNMMTLVDDIKNSIPEGKYLELCNAMKAVFEKKELPAPSTHVVTHEWKHFRFEDGSPHQPFIDIKGGDVIYIQAIHYLIAGSITELTIKFSSGATIVRLNMCHFNRLLQRMFNMTKPNHINYRYPVACGGVDVSAIHSFSKVGVIKADIDRVRTGDLIETHIDGQEPDEEDTDQYLFDLRCEIEENYVRLVISAITDDINKYAVCKAYSS